MLIDIPYHSSYTIACTTVMSLSILWSRFTSGPCPHCICVLYALLIVYVLQNSTCSIRYDPPVLFSTCISGYSNVKRKITFEHYFVWKCHCISSMRVTFCCYKRRPVRFQWPTSGLYDRGVWQQLWLIQTRCYLLLLLPTSRCCNVNQISRRLKTAVTFYSTYLMHH